MVGRLALLLSRHLAGQLIAFLEQGFHPAVQAVGGGAQPFRQRVSMLRSSWMSARAARPVTASMRRTPAAPLPSA